MGLFTSKDFTTLDDLFVEQVRDLYDAERQQVETLPELAGAAEAAELRAALQDQLVETRGQMTRLEALCERLGQKPSGATCQAMKGLLKECEEVVDAQGDLAVKDAALIAAAQRIDHYEIAGYGSARAFAHRLGRDDLAELLQETLDEEVAADRRLTEIAVRQVNPAAQQA